VRQRRRDRALGLLAANPDGLPEAMLAAHGVSIATMVELINAGLATARVQRFGRPRIEVTVVQITDAGREALRAVDYCRC
jgi:hypothetical protein